MYLNKWYLRKILTLSICNEVRETGESRHRQLWQDTGTGCFCLPNIPVLNTKSPTRFYLGTRPEAEEKANWGQMRRSKSYRVRFLRRGSGWDSEKTWSITHAELSPHTESLASWSETSRPPNCQKINSIIELASHFW